MGDRGPSKRMTMADFLLPPPPSPPATANQKNVTTTDHTTISTTTGNSQNDPTTPLPYTIRATKKGGVPCVVETRKHHKVVVLTNIEGDVSALLSALQKSLGTGGVRKGNTIEVQGERHLENITKFCLNSGCVVGASKQNKAEAAAAGKKGKNTKISESTNATTKTTTKPTVDGTAPLSLKEIKTMKPTDLKAQLAARQLSTQGNKKELLARLTASVQGNSA